MKLVLLGLLFSTSLFADDKIIELRIKDHKFNIEKIEVKIVHKFILKILKTNPDRN